MSRFDSCLIIKQILQGRRTDGNYLRKFYLVPSFAALVFCVDITTACYNDFAKVTCDWVKGLTEKELVIGFTILFSVLLQ